MYYTTVCFKQSSVLSVHKELWNLGMCWFAESKTHTESGRGNSVKVVAWKIDKKMGIMQMMIFEEKKKHYEDGWKMSVTWFCV